MLGFGSLAEFWDPRLEYRRPALGASIAIGFAWILRGPGGDATARAAASGNLESLVSPRDQGAD